jgi:preprotein translocase subunit YajC
MGILERIAGILAQEGAAGGAAGAADPAAPGATPPQDPLGGILQMLPIFIILYVVFYFLMIRPQRKQQREHQELLAGLRKNDTVRTSGGIFGKVVSIEPDRDQVVLKVDENQNVRLRVLRSSIAAVLEREEKDEAPAAAAGKPR